MAYYIDTSALTKWVSAEAETGALNAWRDQQSDALVSSYLGRTELLRAARRLTPRHVRVAEQVLSSIQLLKLGTSIFDSAARIGPAELRSLDALHLASAMELGSDLQGIVTYDRRLAEGAVLNAIPVVSPGSSLSET
ncbi:MAG: type II toxin-antitoxin system VapC family toxin [Chloroflexota bacterium]|nr:type II toxin-antitoxin system VapC family toxin [Chloroflexota bacterium]